MIYVNGIAAKYKKKKNWSRTKAKERPLKRFYELVNLVLRFCTERKLSFGGAQMRTRAYGWKIVRKTFFILTHFYNNLHHASLLHVCTRVNVYEHVYSAYQ